MSLAKLKPILNGILAVSYKNSLQSYYLVNSTRNIRLYTGVNLSKDPSKNNQDSKKDSSSSSSSDSSSSSSDDEEKQKQIKNKKLLLYKNVIVSMKKPGMPAPAKRAKPTLQPKTSKIEQPMEEKQPESKQYSKLEMQKSAQPAKREVVETKESKREKEAAFKVAKLINKNEPEKIAVDLLKPLQKERVKPIEPKNVKNAEKEVEDTLFSLLNEINVKVVSPKTGEESAKRSRRGATFEDKYEAHKQETQDEQYPYEKDTRPKTTNKASMDLFMQFNERKSIMKFFTADDYKPSEVQVEESKIWQSFRADKLKELNHTPPVNAFEEAIRLTNEKKLWYFPIDNEQDVTDEDYNMPFHEHVLLDHYLDEFPQLAPVQNFMTLVLNGLSKNAFLTVNEKREAIFWYKNYFDDKIDIIQEAIKLEQESAANA